MNKLLWIRTESNKLIGPYATQAMAEARLAERNELNKNDKGIERATPMEALASHN
jgi:hypothetical protein